VPYRKEPKSWAKEAAMRGIRIEGDFGVKQAQAVVASWELNSEVLLDFHAAHRVEDSALGVLVNGSLDRRVRFQVEGLPQHALRLLRFLGWKAPRAPSRTGVIAWGGNVERALQLF
jgi:hypothetical protein